MKFKAITCALILLFTFDFSRADQDIEGESHGASASPTASAPAATVNPPATSAPAAASVEEDLRDRVPDEKAPRTTASTQSIVGMSEAEQKIKKEKMEKGHPENDATIKRECARIESTKPGFREGSKYWTAATNLIAACERYISSKVMCDATAATASTLCFAGSSIELGTAVASVQAISTAASFAIQDSCSLGAQALDKLQKATSAYAVACGGATVICHKTCGRSTEGLVQFKAYLAETGKLMKVRCREDDLTPDETAEVQRKRQTGSLALPLEAIAPKCTGAARDLEEIVNNLQKPVIEELDVNDEGAVAGKEKICKIDFNKMLLAAGATVAALVTSYAKAGRCHKNTASVAPLNCDDPANQSVPECICRRSPRSQGCPNALVKAGSTGTPVAASVISKPELGTRSALTPEGSTVGRDPAGVPERGQSENVGGAQAGAPMGGGGGGGGSGGGGTGQSGGREMPGSQKNRGFSSNVMGGYEGGGGGGRGGFRSEADMKRAMANYRSNLNPVKVAAQAWSREVTPQSGRSNFEKVKARYNDNRRTLRGE